MDADALTPHAREVAAQLAIRIGADCEPDTIAAILAHDAEVRRQERERIAERLIEASKNQGEAFACCALALFIMGDRLRLKNGEIK